MGNCFRKRLVISALLRPGVMGPRLRGDDSCIYGLYGVLIIVSLKLRWVRAALESSLLRWTSRFLRQATYSDEPAAAPPARQKASSSSVAAATGVSLRDAQAESVSASARAMIEMVGRMRISIWVFTAIV